MGAAAEKLRMSEADYLDWESRAKEKHEYVAGEIRNFRHGRRQRAP